MEDKVRRRGFSIVHFDSSARVSLMPSFLSALEFDLFPSSRDSLSRIVNELGCQ